MPELKWGETPWDAMTRDDLIKETQRLYSALVSTYSALAVMKTGDEFSGSPSPYWGPQGTGGRAVEKARQILDAIHERNSSESIYRCYFRYADDLLFDCSVYAIGFGWSVCPVCGVMLGRPHDPKYAVLGRPCKEVSYNKDCAGIMRPLQWSDLQPTYTEK